MAGISKLVLRFSELAGQLQEVEATKRRESYGGWEGDYVDHERLLNWSVKCLNLLSMACGKESEHYKRFIECEKPGSYETNYDIMQRIRAIFLAAKEDYEGGYLNTVRNLVQAEVFGTELDQARELLARGYLSASAVIAGVVLETTLRQLCTDAGIPAGKLDKMNSDLAKAGRYNLLVQKRITAIADIRNNAAHGHPDKYTHKDVGDMIAYIESFVSECL